MRSLSARTGRALTGLLAIWCLGCTSYDVLLAGLLQGAVAGQSCAMADETPAGTPGGAGSIRAAADGTRTTDGCGCSHCVAVEAFRAPLASAPPPVPEGVVRTLGTALSIDREPLVPPPLA